MSEPAPDTGMGYYPARVIVDLDAIRANLRRLAYAAPSAALMAVVKADGYGHGLLPVAGAAVEAGATWLGTAQLDGAFALRAAGHEVPVLAWVYAPGAPFEAAIAADIDVTVPARWALTEVVDAARVAGRPARVHLKVDTGLGRGGSFLEPWTDLLHAALDAEQRGEVRVVGVWSHLARADEEDHPSVAAQIEVFDEALGRAEAAGARLEVRHLANSAATLAHPRTHYDLVRPGLAGYGLSPFAHRSAADLGLRPAMRLEADLELVKAAPAGQGVSYGHTYTTTRDTVLGVVPLGYGDGIPRHASNVAPVQVAGRRHTVAGRVCMDQFVLDLGPDAGRLEAGEVAVLFGAGDDGEPTVRDWADAVGTIDYEIVTRIGPRIPREYLGAAQATDATGTGGAALAVNLPDQEATEALGRHLAGLLRAGDLVVLTGDLGAGKTTLTRGVGDGLGVRGPIASPTFIIARVHPSLVGGPDLVHVDAYRLGSLDEVDALDLDASLDDSVTVVEWGEGMVESLSEDRLEVSLERPRGAGTDPEGPEPGRVARLHGVGPRWAGIDLQWDRA
ncbi:alanine racemase [Occultella glacieicola]|uniref:Alanine racemase n=1 Tax=Occultella glacieicola TaxID=2518684 RepID=A0ABY2E9G5_9MICO|nr:alanine racemase [Occultella glacieicola]TDE97632.1 alanine racemase [Occultella glacieicola]